MFNPSIAHQYNRSSEHIFRRAVQTAKNKPGQWANAPSAHWSAWRNRRMRRAGRARCVLARRTDRPASHTGAAGAHVGRAAGTTRASCPRLAIWSVDGAPGWCARPLRRRPRSAARLKYFGGILGWLVTRTWWQPSKPVLAVARWTHHPLGVTKFFRGNPRLLFRPSRSRSG